MAKKFLSFFIIYSLIGICMMIFGGCSKNRIDIEQIKAGNLPKCPNKPNCVSSQATGKRHFIDPIVYSGTAKSVIDQLTMIIEKMDGTTIIDKGNAHLVCEFTSKLMKFTDDVIFWIDSAKSQIHVFSASRIGYSDMGVNRKRIETIRSKLKQTNSVP